ncbi:hypothetical protein [Vannielia litorea]|uniref:hypothetical protein n=1 Tax=Vannielia litorea TaxID=1217970 RepID=UPI001BCA777E|nr:hypothetical protein [Vannielia litorea]
MSNQEPDEAGIICGCLLRRERPLGQVVRDADGDWQFLCGVVEHAREDPPDAGVVGVREAFRAFDLPKSVQGLFPGQTAQLGRAREGWQIL